MPWKSRHRARAYWRSPRGKAATARRRRLCYWRGGWMVERLRKIRLAKEALLARAVTE